MSECFLYPEGQMRGKHRAKDKWRKSDQDRLPRISKRETGWQVWVGRCPEPVVHELVLPQLHFRTINHLHKVWLKYVYKHVSCEQLCAES